MRRPSERYDVFNQDTWTHPDEEQHAADVGQPSTAPREHHATVLCQVPTGCACCGRQTKPSVDVLVFVDGEFWHEECLENHGLDGSTDH